MDIQALHIENNAYRDLIEGLKRQIALFDQKIQANEIEIGKQLNEMERVQEEATGECLLCFGQCDNGDGHV